MRWKWKFEWSAVCSECAERTIGSFVLAPDGITWVHDEDFLDLDALKTVLEDAQDGNELADEDWLGAAVKFVSAQHPLHS